MNDRGRSNTRDTEDVSKKRASSEPGRKSFDVAAHPNTSDKFSETVDSLEKQELRKARGNPPDVAAHSNDLATPDTLQNKPELELENLIKRREELQKEVEKLTNSQKNTKNVLGYLAGVDQRLGQNADALQAAVDEILKLTAGGDNNNQPPSQTSDQFVIDWIDNSYQTAIGLKEGELKQLNRNIDQLDRKTDLDQTLEEINRKPWSSFQKDAARGAAETLHRNGLPITGRRRRNSV